MKPQDALLRVIEDKGFLEVASRTRQQLCNIMRYAVQQGLTENNPALHLGGVTVPPVKNHYSLQYWHFLIQKMYQKWNRMNNQ